MLVPWPSNEMPLPDARRELRGFPLFAAPSATISGPAWSRMLLESGATLRNSCFASLSFGLAVTCTDSSKIALHG